MKHAKILIALLISFAIAVIVSRPILAEIKKYEAKYEAKKQLKEMERQLEEEERKYRLKLIEHSYKIAEIEEEYGWDFHSTIRRANRIYKDHTADY